MDRRLIDRVTQEVQKRLLSERSLASYIDHTLLKPDANQKQLDQLCEEAIEHRFFAVCVNSSNIPYVVQKLRGASVKAVAVVGFPLGASATVAKVVEAQEAIRQGAEEIDMVVNIGALKDRNYRLVLDDISQVVQASKPYPVKVIFETAMLERDEKVIACVLSQIAGAAFVKTSTGFGPGGATIDDVKLMRQMVGKNLGVKASGGIRTMQEAQAMLVAGASRLGTSHGVFIVTGKSKGRTFGY